jgi:hypothetical protein
MDRFEDTPHQRSLLHVDEEQPEDPVHLDAQAPRRGFEDGGWQNLTFSRYPYINKLFFYLVS